MDHRYFLEPVNFPGTVLIGYTINDLGHRKYFIDRVRINFGHTISFNFFHSDNSFSIPFHFFTVSNLKNWSDGATIKV
jgi:hypothetical protein